MIPKIINVKESLQRIGRITYFLKFIADEYDLASGGIGGLYKHSTNFPHLTGDALKLQ